LGKFALGVGEYSNFYATENLETKELPEISQSSKLPHLKSFFIDLLEATSKSNLYFWIFWGTWVQSLLTLFICIYSIVRKNWAIFSFSVLILANVAMIILISPAADGRYLYLTSLASFSLVCFTLSLTSRMKGDKLN
jgi:hypothetical protein